MRRLLGFRMGTILTRFHDVLILCVIEKSTISVRALMACVPISAVGVSWRGRLGSWMWRMFFSSHNPFVL